LNAACGIGCFVKVCSFGMVGLAFLIYIRVGLRPYVADVDCDRVKTGLDGATGNKGAVCARLRLGELALCFVNVHLASGQHATAERGQNLAQIFTDAFQATSSTRGSGRPQKHGFQRQSRFRVVDHHLTVIFGDFNSRLDLPKEVVWPPGDQRAWLKKDQLLLGLSSSSLRGFREGLIAFPPTYKYAPGSQKLNHSRCPAWCDRVIFKTEYGATTDLFVYESLPELCRTSDHHPVAAQISVEITEHDSSRAETECFPHAAPSSGSSSQAPASPWPPPAFGHHGDGSWFSTPLL